MSNVARLLVLPFAVGAALVFTAIPGCSDDAPPDSFNPANNGKKDGGSSGGNDSICLLNNCDKDRDCADCSDGAPARGRRRRRPYPFESSGGSLAGTPS
jgi:hypothetical protein